jgi:hypothetical protein
MEIRAVSREEEPFFKGLFPRHGAVLFVSRQFGAFFVSEFPFPRLKFSAAVFVAAAVGQGNRKSAVGSFRLNSV